MEYTIASGGLRAVITDAGAEIRSLCDESNFEYIWQRDPAIWGESAPLLFPVCGRVKDERYTLSGKEYTMHGHGFLKTMTFRLAEKADDRVVLTAVSDDRTRAMYPFDFEITAEYTLSDGAITCRYTVKNTGDGVMPFNFGLHPGITAPFTDGLTIDDCTLDFGAGCRGGYISPLCNGPFVSRAARHFYPFDGGKLDLSEKEITDNDTLVFDSLPHKFVFSDGAGERSFEFSYSDTLPYLCIWKAAGEAARYICLEPWSGTPTDGECAENFDTRDRMERLSSGEERVFSYSMKFRR